jgi:hypothetical protein
MLMSLAALIAGAAVLAVAAAAQTPVTPNPALVQTVPAWSHSIKMPDNRTFVTDGGLVVDVEVGRPAMRPAQQLPPDMAKAFANYLAAAASYPTDIGLGDLRAGGQRNTFVAPDGTVVNANYVIFLRRNAPRVRLHLKSASDPVILTLDQRAVGLLMPLR